MIFSTCVVSHDQTVNNRERLRLLEETLQVLPDDIDIITFPAGYLCCKDMEEVKEYKNKIKELSDKYSAYLAMGIDCQDINEFGSSSQYTLPYLALQASPNKPIRLWRQHLYRSSDVGEVRLSNIVESRSINLGGNNVELVACGDLFNPAVLDNIISRDIDLVIALVHGASGSRTQHALELLAKNGVHGFCSLHAKVKNAFKYGYISTHDGAYENISTRENDYLIKSFNQIEIKVWEL